MNKIASITVNHLNLLPGVYVSRRDYIGSEVVTTFDLRFTRPNLEPPMDNPGIHSITLIVNGAEAGTLDFDLLPAK